MEDNSNITEAKNNKIVEKTKKKIKGKFLNKKSDVKSKLATIAGPIIFWTVVVICVLIILIGIIMFLATMPGMAVQKLKKIFNDLGNYVAAFFGADTTKQISSEQIFNTLDYIEDMGYDLKGFGFLTDYYTQADKSSIIDELSDEYKSDYVIDEKLGVVRSESTNKIILAKSNFIFTYICSDNYIYTLKNTNLVTQTGEGGFLGFLQSIFNGALALIYKLANFLFGGLNDLLGITDAAQDAWGRGLISIHKQDGTNIGVDGGLHNGNGITIDTDKKMLVIRADGKKPASYSLDGWTGRYGMPLEFLLTVHVSTMMPDLAYDMATSFSTVVNVYLNPIKLNTEYQPYIADVRNHWYRDVYYVIVPEKFQETGRNIVDYDYDYQVKYAERWSLYETYSKDDYNEVYKDYAKQNYGEFKLFIINNDGKYLTDDDIGDLKDNPKVEKDVKNGYIYLGTKQEANDEGIVVSKRSVTLNLDEETFKDLGWNNVGERWLAYTSVPLWDGDIKQVGEGLRTETNPTIKKMFLINTYFRYDGSQNTAEIITALRKRVKDDYLGNKTNEYGALNALITSGYDLVDGFKVPKTFDFTETDGFDRKYTATELGLGNDYRITTKNDKGEEVRIDKEYSVSDYVGQVSLNQDSLNAFTMLENMHTLDADFIYRDYKELIVELGYFTKEELTDEVPRLLEFPVPGTPSVNYPERSLDKRESQYGTMIHSKGDIDAFEDYNETKILDTIPSKIAIKSPERTRNGYYRRKQGKGAAPGDMFIIPVEPTAYKLNGTNDDVAETAKTIWKQMASVTDGVAYSNGSSNFAATFKESLEKTDKRSVCDGVFVSWVFKSLGIDVDGILEKTRGVWTSPHDLSRLCIEQLGAEIIFNYRDLQPGDVMATIWDDNEYKDDNGNSYKIDTIQKISILGEEQLDGSFLVYSGSDLPNIGDTKTSLVLDEDTFNNYSLCFGLRLGDDAYKGYLGNEMVVSPVTGILLEYGTYNPSTVDSITEEQYRLNVDLKYGPIASNKSVDSKNEQYSGKSISDEVGYAKILVLNKENYLYLEQSTDNMWNEHIKNNEATYVYDKENSEVKDRRDSLLEDNGKFREELIDDSDSTAEEKVLGRVGNWSFNAEPRWDYMSQTVYGYKEFVEDYESAGIAGYIVYIDGFVCEKPDENLKKTSIMTQIPYQDNSDGKEKARISTDDVTENMKGISYKQITEKNIADPATRLPNMYIEDETYELASEKATNKHEAEKMIKYLASTSVYLNGDIYDKDGKVDIDSLIFIKEGTILGRTMTDKELLESGQVRKDNSLGSYEANREGSLSGDPNKHDKIIGNYIRVIMRDLDKTPVENIENYYKLGAKEPYDWFAILFWVPYESDGVDVPMGGPENISTCTPGELASGIAQWTDLLDHYHEGRDGNGIGSMLRRMVKDDYDLCWPLEDEMRKSNVKRWEDCTGDNIHPIGDYRYLTHQYSVKTGEEFDGKQGYFDVCIKVSPMSPNHPYGYGSLIDPKKGPTADNVNRDWLKHIYCRWDGHLDLYEYACDNIEKSDFQKNLTKVCNMNREKFFKMQRVLAKEGFLDPILVEHPWLEDRPLAVQGALLHTFLGGDQVMRWLNESLTNEEILEHVRHYIANRKSTAGEGNGDESAGRAWNEPEIAYGILDGRLSKYVVEKWTRKSCPKILEDAGLRYSRKSGGEFSFRQN